MRYFAVALVAAMLATAAYAQAPTPTCASQSAEKKLAGAAQKSFMTKCENDAKAACSTSSAEKKLAGAAKTSFETKCVKDKVGS